MQKLGDAPVKCRKCGREIRRDQDGRGWLHVDELAFTQSGERAHVGRPA